MIKNVFNQKSKRKGQSAIEYLTTYGWAILAIVIAGAVIIAFMQGRCPKTQTLTPQDIQLTSWVYTATDAIDVRFTNLASDRITVQGIFLDTNGDGTYDDFGTNYSDSLNVGDSLTKSLSSIGTTSGCNKISIKIQYLLTGMNNPANATGTLQGKAP